MRSLPKFALAFNLMYSLTATAQSLVTAADIDVKKRCARAAVIAVASIRENVNDRAYQRRVQSSILENAFSRPGMEGVRPSPDQVTHAWTAALTALDRGISVHESRSQLIAAGAAACSSNSSALLTTYQADIVVSACTQAALHVQLVAQLHPEPGQSELRSRAAAESPPAILDDSPEARRVAKLAPLFALAELNTLIDAGATRQQPATGDLITASTSGACAATLARLAFISR